jgi:hypothetical protein
MQPRDASAAPAPASRPLPCRRDYRYGRGAGQRRSSLPVARHLCSPTGPSRRQQLGGSPVAPGAAGGPRIQNRWVSTSRRALWSRNALPVVPVTSDSRPRIPSGIRHGAGPCSGLAARPSVIAGRPLDTLPSLGVVLISLGVLLEDFLIVVVGLVVGIGGRARSHARQGRTERHQAPHLTAGAAIQSWAPGQPALARVQSSLASAASLSREHRTRFEAAKCTPWARGGNASNRVGFLSEVRRGFRPVRPVRTCTSPADTADPPSQASHASLRGRDGLDGDTGP